MTGLGYADSVSISAEDVDYCEAIERLLHTDSIKLLTEPTGYAYMVFAEQADSDNFINELLFELNFFARTGYKPTVDDYMSALINIMATTEKENASSIASQRKNDNLKSGWSYMSDSVAILTDTLSVVAGTVDTTGIQMPAVEDYILHAISGASTALGNTTDWIDGISNMQAAVETYYIHLAFLSLIES